MCTIVFSYRSLPGFRLVLAGNRDEFYDRPTEPVRFWPERPDLLAGKDLRWGGIWLGVTRSGKVAAVTNYRDPAQRREHAKSRGLMVHDYLCGDQGPMDYISAIDAAKDDYNGFNLLLADAGTMVHYSNRGTAAGKLDPGIYALSNHLLDTPWPKVVRIKSLFASLLAKDREPNADHLLDLLTDRETAADARLPDTGVGMEWERRLSSIFITSPTYGTRSSSVLTIRDDGQVAFVERRFDSATDPGITVREEFRLTG